jgi:hypothetical protein
MAIRIQYKPLCVVSIRHGYHLNKGFNEFDDLDDVKEKQQKLSRFNIFDDLSLDVPDDTRHTLAGLGMLLKRTSTGFEIAAAAEEVESEPGVFVPRIPPRRAFRLRFVLRARAPFFWDYTNLDLGPRDQKIYYLSNRAGELGGSFPSLAAPPRVYASGTEYRAGDVVRTSPESLQCFVAVRSGALELPESDLDDSPECKDPNWCKIGERNYVSSADLATLYPPTFSFPLPSATTRASAELIESNDTVHEVGSATAPSGKTLDKLMIDARALPPGQYRLRVSGLEDSGNNFNESLSVYIDPALRASRVFSIVELFHEPVEPPEPSQAPLGPFRLYEPVDDGFRLRAWEAEPEGKREFRVYLLNRHTFWRYHFSDPPDPEADLGDLERVGDQFVTKRIMPLTRGVERVAFTGDALLPNPPGGPVVPEADRVYSDIYVHTNRN